MQLYLDYKDAIILRDSGIDALKKALGDEQTARFLALFNYYDISEDAKDLQVKDYTEWRRTQRFYNDPDIDEMLEYFAEKGEKSWHRDENGERVYHD